MARHKTCPSRTARPTTYPAPLPVIRKQYTNARYENRGGRIDYIIVDRELFASRARRGADLPSGGCTPAAGGRSLAPEPESAAAALAAATAGGLWAPAPYDGSGLPEPTTLALEWQFTPPASGIRYMPPGYSDHVCCSLLLDASAAAAGTSASPVFNDAAAMGTVAGSGGGPELPRGASVASHPGAGPAAVGRPLPPWPPTVMLRRTAVTLRACPHLRNISISTYFAAGGPQASDSAAGVAGGAAGGSSPARGAAADVASRAPAAGSAAPKKGIARFFAAANDGGDNQDSRGVKRKQ